MRSRSVIEQPGEGADDVIVVVEHVMVKPTVTGMPLHEDGVGGVHHDLPHVGVFEQLGEGSVHRQVEEGTPGHLCRIGDVVAAQPAAALH